MSDIVQSTVILTELFGYAPIGLIDDIINSVNEILYKCTAALEKYLTGKFPKGSSRAKKYRIPDDEIELGTAKIETLLESVVDRSFDKFELYVLRNLLVLPAQLTQGGWIRLNQHEGIDFSRSNDTTEDMKLNAEILELEKQLVSEQIKNKLYKAQLASASQELNRAEEYQQALKFMTTSLASPDSSKLNEAIIFLSSQASSMVKTISNIESLLEATPLQLQAHAQDRDGYVDKFVLRALRRSGIKLTPLHGLGTGLQEQQVLDSFLTRLKDST